MFCKARLGIGLLAVASLSFGEGIPQAQGPPLPSGATIRDLPVDLVVTGQLKAVIEKKLLETNLELAANSSYKARVSLTKITRWNPRRFQTQYTDRPNEFYVEVPYIVALKVHNITYHSIPYPWTRTITISVRANTFCDRWQLGSGKIKIVGDPDPPYLDADPSFSEAVVNAFLGNWLVPLVNAKVQQGLRGNGPNAFSQTMEGTKCSSIAGYDGDTNTQVDDAIRWSEPFVRPLPVFDATGVTVRPVRIKRLPARGFGGAEVLYDVVESPAFDFFGGYGRYHYELPPMTEGQIVAFPSLPFTVYPKLTPSTSLVVIASLIYPPYGAMVDSAFRVFPSATNYGQGTQTMVISKSYWRYSTTARKPLEYFVPAYEVTFEVSVPVAQPGTGGGPIVGPIGGVLNP